MILHEKSFILIVEPNEVVSIDSYLEGLLRKEARPVLWCRDGLFRIIPIEIALNILEYAAAHLFHNPANYIYWEEGYPIDSKIGYALSGLED